MYLKFAVQDTVYIVVKNNANKIEQKIYKGIVKEAKTDYMLILLDYPHKDIYLKYEVVDTIIHGEFGCTFIVFKYKMDAEKYLQNHLKIDNVREEVKRLIDEISDKQLENIYSYILRERENTNV